MKNVNRLKLRLFAASAMVVVLGAVSPGVTAAPLFDFPAGAACDFRLLVDGVGGHMVQKLFVDKNGDPVRFLTAGTGQALTFTNFDTGTTLSLRSNGAVSQIHFNSDGTYTFVNTGHTILILFPTDVPAGPTTTLYVGRVVFNADSAFNFTLLEHDGTATDVCAALS